MLKPLDESSLIDFGEMEGEYGTRVVAGAVQSIPGPMSWPVICWIF
jgi:hypothetical protein